MPAVIHILGLVLSGFSATFLLPLLCALVAHDGRAPDFLAGAIVSGGAGLALIGLARPHARELKPRDGFLLVTLGLVTLSGVAAIPLLLALPRLSVTAAYFEAMSGLTTTGATLLTGLDHLPPSVNLWRCTLEWFGGLGVIVLGVAALPLLGVGGMQLHRADTPGPMKEERLTPRIASTARSLWLVYCVLTAAGIGALRFAGMSWLDAICHCFSAMSLGSFSTHDASIAYFDSPAIEVVLALIILVAAFNLTRHFVALRQLSLDTYAADPEARAILLVLGLSVLGIALLLQWHHVYRSFGVSLRHALFNVVSIATTCGLVSRDYTQWPVFAPFWMLFLSCLVASTGTAGGGIRMFRTLLLTRQAARELKLLVHPGAIVPVRVGGRAVPERVGHSVLAFIFLYFMAATVLIFLLLASGLDFQSSLGAIIATLNNLGPGLGLVGPGRTYQALNAFQDWTCIIAMLLGRLEIFSVLVLFTPAYWRK